MKISKNFTLEEFIESDTADEKKIDNTPSDEVKKAITELVTQILQPLREGWEIECLRNEYSNPAITINSGYRCPELNKAVGGSKSSGHLTGYAADIVPSNGQMESFQEFVEEWLNCNSIKFDQLIFEKPRNGIASWLHIGLQSRGGLHRKQIFTLV